MIRDRGFRVDTETKTPPSLEIRLREARWNAIGRAVALYTSVALGAVIGGMLRVMASVLIDTNISHGFPWGTMFVNVTGSFAIGFYAMFSGPEGRLFAGSYQRQFVMTGICGGYTTFSVFSLETLRLVQADNLACAGLNVGISVVCWLTAVWIGHMLAIRLNRLKGL